MEELLKYLEQDRALGHSAYLFHAEKPEDIMEQNGKQVESVGEYLCGIYDNRVKRKEAVTLADLRYAWKTKGAFRGFRKRRKRFKVYGISERVVVSVYKSFEIRQNWKKQEATYE